MLRALAVFALLLCACGGTTPAGPGADAASRESSAAESRHASSGASSAHRSSAVVPSFCDGLAQCCPGLFQSTGEPSCDAVSVYGNETFCGLTLEALQGSYVGETGILSADSQCGGTEYPVAGVNAACNALGVCCRTIADQNASAACWAIDYPNYAHPCASGLAYFKSRGVCKDADIDAGTWTGLPPNLGAGDISGHASAGVTASSGAGSGSRR